MRFRLILFICASLLCSSVAAAPRATLVEFRKASQQQVKMLATVLGEEAVGAGAVSFPEQNLIAEVALDGKTNALLALTRSACSNHACSIEVLVNQNDTWKHIASFETWAPPYVLDQSTNGLRDLVVFDHVTDDCMACSPPQPVRMSWDPEAELSDTEKGNYVSAGTVAKADRHFYKLTRYKNPK